MNIRPIRNRIVVKPIEGDTGEYVEATGETVAPPLEVGDKVFYGKYAGTDVKVGGEEYKILEVKDVLAKYV